MQPLEEKKVGNKKNVGKKNKKNPEKVGNWTYSKIGKSTKSEKVGNP